MARVVQSWVISPGATVATFPSRVKSENVIRAIKTNETPLFFGLFKA